MKTIETFCKCGEYKKTKKKGANFMKNKEYSRSTDTSNASKIYDNLSDSNKLLIAAMMNTMLVLLQNMQYLQNYDKNDKTVSIGKR